MIYSDYQGEKLSMCAMGCMRMPVIDGVDSNLDEAAFFEMVDYAMQNGVNYYDVAYGYHGGNAETVVGKALARHPRASFNLASKFPGYDSSCWGKVEEIFEEQLRKCQVEYFDFYLFHNVCESNIDAYLDEERYGIYPYLIQQKRNGRIRHLGLSAHGSVETMERFLQAYGADMEFCQIQLNYIDYQLQNAKEKIELCERYGIPVWVMEPLRGGMLAKATPEEAAKLAALRDESVAAWALRWLQTLPQVKVVLCGSSTLEQLKENIATFAEAKPLNDAEMQTITDIATARLNASIMPCTACRYCTSHCPQQIDIPRVLEMYNEQKFTGSGFIVPMLLGKVPEGQRPSDCVACGSCSEVCPQQIDIPAAMKDLVDLLEHNPFFD